MWPVLPPSYLTKSINTKQVLGSSWLNPENGDTGNSKYQAPNHK